MKKPKNDDSTDAAPLNKDDQESTRQITSQALFKGTKVISILHNNERYSLRITRQNKLILTK